MRLYLTSTGEWTGNQSDAAGLVRANGGTWEQIDVPTDKPGLIAWLTQQWTRFPTIAAPSAPITAPTETDAQRADSLRRIIRSEEHTSELPSLMRISYAVSRFNKTNTSRDTHYTNSKLLTQTRYH